MTPLLRTTPPGNPRRFLTHPYDVRGFFGILCSPPLANTLQIYIAPQANAAAAPEDAS